MANDHPKGLGLISRAADTAINPLISHPYPIRELRLSRKALLLADDEDEQDDEVLAVM